MLNLDSLIKAPVTHRHRSNWLVGPHVLILKYYCGIPEMKLVNVFCINVTSSNCQVKSTLFFLDAAVLVFPNAPFAHVAVKLFG